LDRRTPQQHQQHRAHPASTAIGHPKTKESHRARAVQLIQLNPSFVAPTTLDDIIMKHLFHPYIGYHENTNKINSFNK